MDAFFYKGKENVLENNKNQEPGYNHNSEIKKIKDAFLKVLDNKNLSFLLGSGCSSCEIEQRKESTEEKTFLQIGIPVMAPLAREYYNLKEFKDDKDWLKSKLQIDVESEVFKTNLEVFLSTLHSLSYYYDKRTKPVEVEAKIEGQDDVV